MPTEQNVSTKKLYTSAKKSNLELLRLMGRNWKESTDWLCAIGKRINKNKHWVRMIIRSRERLQDRLISKKNHVMVMFRIYEFGKHFRDDWVNHYIFHTIKTHVWICNKGVKLDVDKTNCVNKTIVHVNQKKQSGIT